MFSCCCCRCAVVLTKGPSVNAFVTVIQSVPTESRDVSAPETVGISVVLVSWLDANVTQNCASALSKAAPKIAVSARIHRSSSIRSAEWSVDGLTSMAGVRLSLLVASSFCGKLNVVKWKIIFGNEWWVVQGYRNWQKMVTSTKLTSFRYWDVPFRGERTFWSFAKVQINNIEN